MSNFGTASTASRRGPPGWWWAAAAIAAALFFLSSRGSLPLPLPHPLDWLLHTLAYLALGFCLGKATGNWRLAWLLAAWFGALDEVHQAFVPPREAGIGDWWFDLLGGGLGAWRAAGRPETAPPNIPMLDVHFDAPINDSFDDLRDSAD